MFRYQAGSARATSRPSPSPLSEPALPPPPPPRAAPKRSSPRPRRRSRAAAGSRPSTAIGGSSRSIRRTGRRRSAGRARSINQHRLVEAAERGGRPLPLNPHSAEARAVLAVALDWSGQVDRAVQVGLEAVELDRSSPTALAALAEAYSDQYRLREADELLAKALELAPDDPEVLSGRRASSARPAPTTPAPSSRTRGRSSLRRTGRTCTSVWATRSARRSSTTRRWRRSAGRPSCRRPMPAPRAGGAWSTTPARSTSTPSSGSSARIELDPTYATAYAQLAWIHYGRREYDRAEPLFVRAIELDRDGGRVAQYRHALGWIYVSVEAHRRGARAVHPGAGAEPGPPGRPRRAGAAPGRAHRRSR